MRLAFRWRFFLSLGAAGDRTLIEHATDIRMRAEDQAGILLRKMAEHDERPRGQKKRVARCYSFRPRRDQDAVEPMEKLPAIPMPLLKRSVTLGQPPATEPPPTGAKARGRRGFGAVTVDAPLMRKAQRQRRSLNMRMMLKILIPTETGNHTIKDGSGVVEPLFAGLNARVQLLPVMNAEDLKKGLDTARQAM